MNIKDKMQYLKDNALSINDSLINKTSCDYCGTEIFAVWDIHNIKDWNPYIGNSAIQKSRFKYSKIINLIRDGLYIKDYDKIIYPKDLISTNARIHSEPEEDSIRFSEDVAKILCIDCFKKTFNRIKFIGIPNDFYPEDIRFEHTFSASVIKESELLESVAKDCHIDIIKIIGKGRIEEYR